MNTVINAKLSDTERLKVLLYQSIHSPGLNPENTFLLLEQLLRKEFADENTDATSRRFLQFVRGHRPEGLEMDPQMLMKVIREFKHPHEMPPHEDPKLIERMRWMRERVTRLLPGEARDKAGRPPVDNTHNMSITVHPESPAGIMRRLNRDRPDLAERVASGEISANKAAIEAGFRKKRRCKYCGHEL